MVESEGQGHGIQVHGLRASQVGEEVAEAEGEHSQGGHEDEESDVDEEEQADRGCLQPQGLDGQSHRAAAEPGICIGRAAR